MVDEARATLIERAIAEYGPATALADPASAERSSVGPQIIEELRRGGDARHQQMVAGARAGDVEEVSLRLVDVFEVCLVGDVLNA